MCGESSGSRSLLGFLLVFVGVWFLLERLEVMNLGGPWPWIPSFFIVFVLWQMGRADFRNPLGPLILVALAALVQLAIIGDRYDLKFEAFWPAVIILLGLGVMLRGRWWGGRRTRPAGEDLDVLAVFGNSEERVAGADFKGGRVTAIIGAVRIDLRDATIGDQPATVDLAVTIGNCSLIVPDHWIVDRHATTVFGGNSDKRWAAPSDPDGPRLVVTGIVLFGELGIKS
jgi:hypothetical protein